MIELTWVASASASALHAAGAMLAGKTLVDARLAELLVEPAAALQAALAARGLAADAVFAHLIPLSAGIGGNAELAETTLRKAVGPQSASASAGLGHAIGRCEAAYLAVHPQAADELALRIGPLREQWEARGPGLLASARRLTEPGLFAERAQVIGIEPVLGGGGSAHPHYNLVTIEAVLANPHAELPEVVRLGWLLAQLQLDMPAVQGELGRDRAARVGALALLPAVATAAEEVELVPGRDAAIAAAIQHWGIAGVEGSLLLDWWDTYASARPAWHIAMGALDRMLGS